MHNYRAKLGRYLIENICYCQFNEDGPNVDCKYKVQEAGVYSGIKIANLAGKH